jgi:hypothetical protein
VLVGAQVKQNDVEKRDQARVFFGKRKRKKPAKGERRNLPDLI